MKIEKFNACNSAKSMPKENIGQGFGYKDADFDWNTGSFSDIIYIPEYGYEQDDTVKRENAFSKQDFIDLVKDWVEDNFPDKRLFDQEIDHMAMVLFDLCDWQFPSSLLDGDGIFDDYFQDDD